MGVEHESCLQDFRYALTRSCEEQRLHVRCAADSDLGVGATSAVFGGECVSSSLRCYRERERLRSAAFTTQRRLVGPYTQRQESAAGNEREAFVLRKSA